MRLRLRLTCRHKRLLACGAPRRPERAALQSSKCAVLCTIYRPTGMRPERAAVQSSKCAAPLLFRSSAPLSASTRHVRPNSIHPRTCTDTRARARPQSRARARAHDSDRSSAAADCKSARLCRRRMDGTGPAGLFLLRAEPPLLSVSARLVRIRGPSRRGRGATPCGHICIGTAPAETETGAGFHAVRSSARRRWPARAASGAHGGPP